jgi:hypothetical protein
LAKETTGRSKGKDGSSGKQNRNVGGGERSKKYQPGGKWPVMREERHNETSSETGPTGHMPSLLSPEVLVVSSR